MADPVDIARYARTWLATAPRSWQSTASARYAPVLLELLRNGPLDDDALLDALDECAGTGDSTAARLCGQLLLCTDDEREAFTEALTGGAR